MPDELALCVYVVVRGVADRDVLVAHGARGVVAGRAAVVVLELDAAVDEAVVDRAGADDGQVVPRIVAQVGRALDGAVRRAVVVPGVADAAAPRGLALSLKLENAASTVKQ